MEKKFFDKAFVSLPALSEAVDLCMILGSGWGEVLQVDEELARINYGDIKGLGRAQVQGHAGELRVFRRHNKVVAAFCGRRHYYEGVGWEAVVAPVELARRLGAKTMLLTNAAGGINPALHAGDFVIIKDHVNTVGINPFIGEHNPEWGARFPDMTEVYPRELRTILRSAARKCGVRAMDGVYAFTSGPVYETPAEVHAYKLWGADVVGMSTVPEAVFAKACGMRVAGISFVANLASGIAENPLEHKEIIAAAEAARSSMATMIDIFIEKLK